MTWQESPLFCPFLPYDYLLVRGHYHPNIYTALTPCAYKGWSAVAALATEIKIDQSPFKSLSRDQDNPWLTILRRCHYHFVLRTTANQHWSSNQQGIVTYTLLKHLWPGSKLNQAIMTSFESQSRDQGDFQTVSRTHCCNLTFQSLKSSNQELQKGKITLNQALQNRMMQGFKQLSVFLLIKNLDHSHKSITKWCT